MTDSLNELLPAITYFLNSAKKHPEKIALIDGGWKLTYAELERRSRVVAESINELKEATAASGSPEIKRSIIWAESDAWGVISILAASRVGFTYVFLEPTTSIEFAREVFEQFQPNYILTTEKSTIPDEFLASIPHNNRQLIWVDAYDTEGVYFDEANWNLDDPAMTYFTSGSTGKPKGLVISQRINTHRTLENTLYPFMRSDDIIALSMSFSFARSPEAMWMAFAKGATAAIYRFQDHTLTEVAEWIEANKLTILQMPSNFADRFIQAMKLHPEYTLETLRLIGVGGEKLGLEAVRQYQKIPWLKFSVRYQIGSSETSSYYYTDYDRGSDVGDQLWFERVTPGSVIFLMDDNGKLINGAGIGELYVGSRKLFLSYLNTTQGAGGGFVHHADAPGGRLYPTGDIGEIDQNGRMRIIGRKDKMVKIRGYRMDLDEIREGIRSLPEVKDAVVIPIKNRRGEAQLHGYVCFEQNKKLTQPNLRSALSPILNPYKIPARYTFLEEMPYSAGGKVNISELPTPSKKRPELDTAFAPPANKSQILLASVWMEVLDLDEIGLNDSFFDLGGDSISVLEMSQLVEQRLGIQVPAGFVDKPTISSLLSIKDDLESIKEQNDRVASRNREFRKNRTEKYIQKYSFNPIARIAGWVLRWIDYRKAFNVLAGLSGNWFVKQIFFFKHKKWYFRWIERLPLEHQDGSYRKYIFAVLSHFIGRGLNITGVEKLNYTVGQLHSPVKFISSLTAAARQVPKNASFDEFPFYGFEHLLEAMKSSKPVFLVSFHSNVRYDTRSYLEFILGRTIRTVTHNLGVLGKYGYGEQAQNPTERNASNAGVSIQAMRLISEGHILAFYSDTNDPMTKNYVFPILGREFALKGGFAEIGEAVGAEIIPTTSFVTDDLRVASIFFPPLKTNKTESAERIEDLVRQYAAFIEKIYTDHPETMTLHKIKQFYSRRRV